MHLPVLIADQRQAIDQHGIPLPIIDELTGKTYILMSVEFIPDPDLGGITARIPGIAAYGEGETEQEASFALCEALRGYLEAFSDN